MSEVKYDFTEGHLFSKGSTEDTINRLLMRSLGLEFPWKWCEMHQVTCDADLDEEVRNPKLFLEGTNIQIRDKLYYKQMENKSYGKIVCECCGETFIRFSWVSIYEYSGLCSKCRKRMNKDLGPDIFGMPKNSNRIENPWWLVV